MAASDQIKRTRRNALMNSIGWGTRSNFRRLITIRHEPKYQMPGRDEPFNAWVLAIVDEDAKGRPDTIDLVPVEFTDGFAHEMAFLQAIEMGDAARLPVFLIRPYCESELLHIPAQIRPDCMTEAGWEARDKAAAKATANFARTLIGPR